MTAGDKLQNELPLAVSDRVVATVISASDKPTEMPAASVFLAKSMDETGFVKNVTSQPGQGLLE